MVTCILGASTSKANLALEILKTEHSLFSLTVLSQVETQSTCLVHQLTTLHSRRRSISFRCSKGQSPRKHQQAASLESSAVRRKESTQALSSMTTPTVQMLLLQVPILQTKDKSWQPEPQASKMASAMLDQAAIVRVRASLMLVSKS